MSCLIHSAAFAALLAASAAFAQPAAVVPAPAGAPRSVRELSDGLDALAAQVTPAVVQILVKGYAPAEGSSGELLARRAGTGSGVVATPDGYVITNAHVVAGARTVQVQFAAEYRVPGGKSILKSRGKVVGGQIVGIDRETDLAVVKIDPATLGGATLSTLPLGDSEELAQGQLVFAFGSPFGLESTITMGVVSAVARQVEPDAPMVYIQTDAAINPGNSGGPLVDANGRVVGINTFILSRSGGSEGVGFAIPSNIVKAVFEQLRTNGRVRRGMIGVHAQTVTPLLATGLKLGRDWGVVLSDVFPDGPAAKAGLHSGDLVQTLDGKTMENARQFDVNLYRRRVGDTVLLAVERGGQKLEARVQIVELASDPGRFMDLVSPDRNLVPHLGILALELNKQVASLMPTLRKQTGVVVAASAAASFHEEEVFAPGDVIYAMNGAPVAGLAALREAAAKLHPGDAVVAQVERRGELVYVAFEAE